MLPDYTQRTVLTNDVRQTMMTTCQRADSDIGVVRETCYRLLRSWPRNWRQISSQQQCIAAAISAAKPPASCSNAHVRSPRRSQSCRRFAAWRSGQSGTRDLPGAVAGQNAVATCLRQRRAWLLVAPNVARRAVSGTVNATRNIGFKFCNCDRRKSPAFTHCGRKATTAVTYCRDGNPLHRFKVQPLGGSGVRIRRHDCVRSALTRFRRACHLFLHRLFEEEPEAMLFKVHGCPRSVPNQDIARESQHETRPQLTADS